MKYLYCSCMRMLSEWDHKRRQKGNLFLHISVLTIAPKQAFFDWAKSLENLDESEQELELDDLKNDTSAYVVPPIESVEDLQYILEENFLSMFRNELYGWNQDPDTWPEELSLDLFNEWFNVSLHSIAYDLAPDGTGEVSEE